MDIYSPTFDLAKLAPLLKGNAAVALKNLSFGGSPASANLSTHSPISEEAEFKVILPPRAVAVELIEAVWEHACVLYRFYHRPSFIRDLDLLYESDPEDYSDKQLRILPLAYSIMAVGVLFSMDKAEQLGFKDASEGYKYFMAARKQLDITDARDLYAIQSTVMMVIFLQCSARLSTCYSYVGIAMRQVLRAGLHRKVNKNFNYVELETRKRLFWTVRKMDIYISAMLGLPRSVDEEDFDQEYPLELDDENITEDSLYQQAEGHLSSSGIANAHTRLMNILGHIVKRIYPVRPEASMQQQDPPPPSKYRMTFAAVMEMEQEIYQWRQQLPAPLYPASADVPAPYFKANRLLTISYCYIQLVLYRPFIHYCSPRFRDSKDPVDERAKTYGRKCIGVAKQAVFVCNELVQKKMLKGAYWFSVYAVFFSVASLVYFVHENYDDPEAAEIQQVAELGKDCLRQLRDGSTAADRTYKLLNSMFEELNAKTSRIAKSNLRVLGDTAIADAPNFSDKIASTPGKPGGGILEDDESVPVKGEQRGNGTSEPMQPPPKRARQQQQQQQQPYVPSQRPNDVSPSELSSNMLGGDYDAGMLGSSSGNQMTYVPGLMDQFDTQLFGRFLPPFMMTNGGDFGGFDAAAGEGVAPAAGATGTTGPDSSTMMIGTPATAQSTAESGLQSATPSQLGDVQPPFDPSVDQSAGTGGSSWDEFVSQQMELSGISGI